MLLHDVKWSFGERSIGSSVTWQELVTLWLS